MAKTQKSYVVGYASSGNCIWGKIEPYPEEYRVGLGGHGVATPMTYKQAKALLDTMPCAGAAIFKLVPVEINR